MPHKSQFPVVSAPVFSWLWRHGRTHFWVFVISFRCGFPLDFLHLRVPKMNPYSLYATVKASTSTRETLTPLYILRNHLLLGPRACRLGNAGWSMNPRYPLMSLPSQRWNYKYAPLKPALCWFWGQIQVLRFIQQRLCQLSSLHSFLCPSVTPRLCL